MRHRLPPAVAKATGAAIKNPGRHEGRNDPSSPLLGEPSRFLTAAQKRAWRQFKNELPWLVEADRAMVDLAAAFRAQFAAGEGMKINVAQVYSAVLSKLGATPVDRSRTTGQPDRGEVDKFFDW